jgi:glycine/D-amino acid oxidase-like deaminating enzyme
MGHRVMGEPSSTAQINPHLFTKSMVELAEERGVKVTIASVDGMEFEEDGKTPAGVLATNDSGERIKIPATDVLFAAGPWTATVAKKLLGRRANAALDIGPRYIFALAV